MSKLKVTSTAQINTLERLLLLPYQTAKLAIAQMDIAQATKLNDELKTHLEYTYTKTSGYAAPRIVSTKKDAEGNVIPIVQQPRVQPKDFSALMGGIKKLEIIYGYFYDKLNMTQFSEVR